VSTLKHTKGALPSVFPVQFGRYSLLGLLGEGGMAKVFRAELRGPAGFRKSVAIKILKPEIQELMSGEVLKRFVLEARLGGVLKHPHIVDVYELDEVEGQLFMAMELVEGFCLARLFKTGVRPPPSVGLEIGLAVAAGLAKAHSLRLGGRPAGLVHRDLKFSNILVSWDGAVKVMDFGVASIHPNLPGAVPLAEGQVVGTRAYMAPEQLFGREVDARADLFSLGIVVYLLCTGERPIAKGGVVAHFREAGASPGLLLSDEAAARIDALVPGLGPVFARCLAAAPSHRYQRAEDLEAAFEDALSGLSGAPRLKSWLHELRQQLPDELLQSLRGTDAETSVSWVSGEGSGASAELSSPLEETSPALRRSNLPRARDSFFGREHELAQLGAAVEGAARLITLKGTGGVGKTRLSRQFGRTQLSQFAGGVWFCELDEAQDRIDLVRSLASALSLSFEAQDDVQQLVVQLGHALAERGPVLVILDNFEQLAELASETVGLWLDLAPAAVFLVTSRQPLQVRGEYVVDLPPLSDADGVTLFEARARAAGGRWDADARSDEAIAKIVATLDSIPLAIELAAARTAQLAPHALLELLGRRFDLLRSRSRDLRDRQRTLWGMIESSWMLLEQWEQAALAQLSMFRGGFSMEAAEAVLDLSAWRTAPWVVDVVGDLLDRSLIYSWQTDGQPRFGMYASIREFAAEKLCEPGAIASVGEMRQSGPGPAAAARSRHGAHYARLGTVQSLQRINSSGGGALRRVLHGELDNLLAGARMGVEQGDGEIAGHCAIAAGWVFEAKGPLISGAELLAEVLDNTEPEPQTRERVLRWRGIMLVKLGRGGEALALYEEALAIGEQTGTSKNTGRVLGNIGVLHYGQGNLDQALEFFGRTLDYNRAAGSQMGESMALVNLGNVHRDRGHFDAARRCFSSALVNFQSLGNRRGEAVCLVNLGLLDKIVGQLDSALPQCEEALSITRELGDSRTEGCVLGTLGELRMEQGDTESATAYLEQAISLCDQSMPEFAGSFCGSLAIARARGGDVPGARRLLARGMEMLRGSNKIGLGGLYCHQVEVELAGGDAEAARRAIVEAEALVQTMGLGSEAPLCQSVQRGRTALMTLEGQG